MVITACFFLIRTCRRDGALVIRKHSTKYFCGRLSCNIINFNQQASFCLEKFLYTFRNCGPDCWFSLILTGICYAVMSATFLLSLTFINKATATIIMEAWPIGAMLLSILIVQKKDWRKISLFDILVAFISFSGVAMLILAGSTEQVTDFSLRSFLYGTDQKQFIGGILAITCMISIVLSTLFKARVAYRLEQTDAQNDPIISSTFADFFPRLFSLPVVWFFFAGSGETLTLSLDKALLYALITGLLCYTISTILHVVAILKSESPNIHIYWFMMPVLSVFFLWLFGLEELNVVILLSMLIVVSSNMALGLKNIIAEQKIKGPVTEHTPMDLANNPSEESLNYESETPSQETNRTK